MICCRNGDLLELQSISKPIMSFGSSYFEELCTNKGHGCFRGIDKPAYCVTVNAPSKHY